MPDFFSSIAARSGACVAGRRANLALSHAAFLERVAAWRALCLRSEGTQAALYLDDSVEFGAALLGAWQAGKTVWLSADTLEASCSALAAQVDVFLGDFPGQYGPRLPAAGEHCALPWITLAPDFAALVVHTSGSTGEPQAISKQLSQLTSEVATLEALFGAAIGQADIIATVSHQHIYGLLFRVLWPLAAGRPIDAHSIAFPEQLASVLGQRPCVLVASPAHLKRLPAHIDWNAAASMLRAVFSSGGPLAPDAGAAAASLLGCLPTEIYGSSETGGVAWRRRHGATGGAWEAMPGVQWRAAHGGQLEVRSPHLDSDAWLRLADRIEPAGASHFMLLGRSDRIVKIEEKRVSLDTIETALSASGLATEARVMLAPDAAGSVERERQSLAAFVVLNAAGRALLATEGKPALNRRLRAHLAHSVEAVALPRRWRYLDQLPVNAQGKTTQRQLLALLGGGQDAEQGAGQDAGAAPQVRLPHCKVLEQGPGRVLLALTVPAALHYLKGHFRDAPVLPGVVQVDWAIHYGRQQFALAGAFRGINALKFQQVIRPDVPLLLELSHDSDKGSLQFRYFSDAGPHAGGRILFGP